MTRIEQSVADIFNDYMRKQSEKSGSEYHYFSLGGQDRDAGADYLVSNSYGFSIIEFKHSELELKEEGSKKRRKNLCILLQLEKNKNMREIHDKCHFAAWMDSETGEIKCVPYRSEICNRFIFPKCNEIHQPAPMVEDRITAVDYCEQFIIPPPERYVTKQDFERYLAWLMKVTSGSKSETVQLMAKSLEGCAAIRLNSVDAAYQWMQKVPGMSLKPLQNSTGFEI